MIPCLDVFEKAWLIVKDATEMQLVQVNCELVVSTVARPSCCEKPC